MSKITADERVEILDNGSHLAWTTVDDGRWDYSHAGLSVGSHNLTAQYRGRRSAAWRVDIEGASTDGFTGEPTGNPTLVTRPRFVVRRREGGEGGPFEWAVIHVSDSLTNLPNFTVPVLGVKIGSRTTSFPHRKLVVEIEFNNPYSTVSFPCKVFRLSDASATSSQVEAFDANGAYVGSGDVGAVNLRSWPNLTERTLTLGQQGRRNLKLLRFTQTVSQAVAYDYEEVWLNSITMTP